MDNAQTAVISTNMLITPIFAWDVTLNAKSVLEVPKINAYLVIQTVKINYFKKSFYNKRNKFINKLKYFCLNKI
jgi:hypothetical protein